MICLHKEMRFISASLMFLVLTGCVTGYQHIPAPVEDRFQSPSAGSQPNSSSQDVQAGQYVVRLGDTLIRIGLEHGQNWRDIAKWNNIDNPDRIEVGQILKVQPPGPESATVEPSGVVVNPVTRTQIIESNTQTPQISQSKETPSVTQTNPDLSTSGDKSSQPPKEAAPRQPISSPTDISFVMPSKGRVIGAFDGAKNKGIDIAGKLGDPVISAADGRVVYAGSGLRGYGNLIIIKHNNTYLTAYAHNDKILVKEDQFIKSGQKIAEMGNSESDQVKLHFEIRKMGKPVDPAPYLNAQ